MTTRRTLLAVAMCLASAAALATQTGEPLSFAALMKAFARVTSGQARFTESRYVSTLEQTLQSSGRLSFQAPNLFVRETLSPRHEKLTVDGNVLTIVQGTRIRTLQLDTVPEAQASIEAVRATLTGRGDTLAALFETRVAGDWNAWSLTLAPRDAQLRASVREIVMRGRSAQVLEVELFLPDGDRSVMRIEPLVPTAASAASKP